MCIGQWTWNSLNDETVTAKSVYEYKENVIRLGMETGHFKPYMYNWVNTHALPKVIICTHIVVAAAAVAAAAYYLHYLAPAVE